MDAFITVSNSSNVTIKNSGCSKFKIGVDISGSNGVLVDGMVFDDVETGVKARRVIGLKALNNIETSKGIFHSDNIETSKATFHLTPVAQLVRMYVNSCK
tara:strand:+ start:524 stop:823 length:300 start_codon:yes stop_codon:yes gene_type:complete